MSTKVALVSDTHLTSEFPESASLFPKYLSRLPADQARQIYSDFRRVTAEANASFVSWLRKEGRTAPIDILIHFGDITGGWNEEGLAHPSVQPLAAEYIRQCKAESRNLRICFGNHDTGYGPKGISPASLKACAKLSRLYWKFEAEKLCFVGICSPLASYTGDDPEIIAEREKQAAFVARKLAGRRNRSWALCTHDPFLPESFLKILEPHEKPLRYLIYGDLHRSSVGRALKLAAQIPFMERLPGRAGIIARMLRKSIFCPSVAPAWWAGHAFLSGTVAGTRIAIEEFGLPAYPEDRLIPTASVLNGLKWRFATKKVPNKFSDDKKRPT